MPCKHFDIFDQITIDHRGHPKGEGKLRLITFMTDDYPNSWTAEKEIEESVWYHIQVVFTPATGAMEFDRIRRSQGMWNHLSS